MAGRVQWMDHVRGAAIVLVIMFHANTLLRFGYTSPDALTVANDLFSPYRMPLLAFISGFIAFMSLRKPFGTFTSGKLRNLAWPYFVWSAVYAMTAGSIYSITNHELYISYLWYLMYIFVYYFISRFTLSIPRIPLILITFALAAAIPADVDSVRRFFFLWGVFMLGELAHSESHSWERLVSSRWVYLAIVPMVVVSAVAFSGQKVLYDAAWTAATIAGILVFSSIAISLRRFENSAPMRTLAFLGRNAVVYYTSHFPIIWATVLACAALGVQSPWPVYFVGAAVAFAGGTLLAFAAKTRVGSILFSFPDLRRKRLVDRSAPELMKHS